MYLNGGFIITINITIIVFSYEANLRDLTCIFSLKIYFQLLIFRVLYSSLSSYFPRLSPLSITNITSSLSCPLTSSIINSSPSSYCISFLFLLQAPSSSSPTTHLLLLLLVLFVLSSTRHHHHRTSPSSASFLHL